MPTPHPHQELARRLMPIAAYIREFDVDGQLAQAAVRGLAEYLGLDIVVVDHDPEQRLEDLGREYLEVMGQMAEHPEPEVRAALPGMVYGLVKMAVVELNEMFERERDGFPPTKKIDRASLRTRPS